MSALSFLNILLSVIHLAALAAFVVSCGVLFSQVVKMFSRRKIQWPYQLVEVCITVLGYSAMALWLSALPDALYLSALPARHFSIFGIVNLELFVLATGALIAIVLRAQDRYPSRKKPISGTLDSIVFRLLVSCFLASFLMAIFQLTPDNIVPVQFSAIENDVLTMDLFLILLLTTLFLFVVLMALNDTWINYRFTRGRGALSLKFTNNDFNLLNSRHKR